MSHHSVFPEKEKCPICKKKHKIRVDGSMHYLLCKKVNTRLFVGWENKFMLRPPKSELRT